MAILYIDEQGSSLYREKGVLIVKKDSNIIKEIPIAQVEKIIIVGGIFISLSAFSLILNNSIFTSFITINGKYKGSLFSGYSKNIFLRLKQFEKYNNIDFREKFSRLIVVNKIKNLHAFLLKYKRNHKDCDIYFEIEKIKEILNQIKNVKRFTIQQLFGIEGISAKHYFKAFGKMIRKEFYFTKRTSHPPRDEVNSLLGLGYTLLFNEFVSLIYANGLDPFIGFYHGLEYGRESLAVDLMEEFRFAIDSLVLSLINKQVVKKSDFEFNKEIGFYTLKDRCRKNFYLQYENKIRTEIHDTENNLIADYRKLFHNQIIKFIKFLENDDNIYVPYNYR